MTTYIQASWATSSKKQSEKLLEVIRRLAEDDKDGVMANKVLYRKNGIFHCFIGTCVIKKVYSYRY